MANASVIQLKPMFIERRQFTIESLSPLIQHAWSQKALQQMRDKHAGKKTKNRDVRDPNAEFQEAMYRTRDGQYGIPAVNLKSAIVCAAHKDLGVEKTLVRKGLFICAAPEDPILPMRCAEPVMREDCVRVGVGSTDLRYRPQFDWWELDFIVEFDAELLTDGVIASLIDRAGFGVGLHEWRPERSGEFGRFRVKRG